MKISSAQKAKQDIQLSLRVLGAVIRSEKPEPDAVRQLVARCPKEFRDLPPDEIACLLIRREVAALHASEPRRAVSAPF